MTQKEKVLKDILGCNFLLPTLLDDNGLHWQSPHCGDPVCWLPQLWFRSIPDDLVPLFHWHSQYCQGKQ